MARTQMRMVGAAKRTISLNGRHETLIRRAKAVAMLRGMELGEFVAVAIEQAINRDSQLASKLVPELMAPEYQTGRPKGRLGVMKGFEATLNLGTLPPPPSFESAAASPPLQVSANGPTSQPELPEPGPEADLEPEPPIEPEPAPEAPETSNA